MLMDYLYGEMTPEQRREFEQLLANDPALARELEELREARSLLTEIEEVTPEPTIVSIKPYVSPWRKWGWPLGIAASFLLLLSLTNARFEATNGQVTLSFGKAQPVVAVASPEEEVQVPALDETFEQKILAIDSVWQTRMLAQEIRMKKAWQKQLQNSMARLTSEIREEQYPEIANLVQNLQIRQQEEIQILLTNFWQEYQQTRHSDMESIGTEFTNVYHNLQNNKTETEAMFVNLLSNGSF